MNGPTEKNLQHSPEPLPVRRGGSHRPPLETRTNWDPWLPATEAYPEVPAPLRVLTIAVLSLLAITVLIALLAML